MTPYPRKRATRAPPGRARLWRTLLLFGFALLLACGPASETPTAQSRAQSNAPDDRKPRRGRVLLIGIDGASSRVIDPMLKSGRLPNIAALAEAGAAGPLRATLPLSSPRIWTTIATGKLPDKHGIVNFFHHADGQRHLFDSTQRRTHALWNIASERGLEVGVVNWWTTHPPEKINGILISDHFLAAHMRSIRELFHVASEARGPVTYPADWLEGVPERLEHMPPPTAVSDPFADASELPHWVADVPDEAGSPYLTRVFRDDSTLVQLALAIDDEIEPDLLMILLLGIDRVSHILWGTLEAADLYPEELRPTDAERAHGAAALRRYYEYTDALIGALLARYGPDDTVFVVSDHGFEAEVGSRGVTGGHHGIDAVDGVLFARGPDIAPGSSSEKTRIADITPTLLALMGLPQAGDFDGEVAAFVTRTPTETIETYDGASIEYLDGEASSVERDIIERLQALGYTDAKAAPATAPSPAAPPVPVPDPSPIQTFESPSPATGPAPGDPR